VNTAVKECPPTASAVVDTEAAPDTEVTFCVVPTWVAPSMNLTVPAAFGVTSAFRVTFVPTTCGDDGVADSAVEVGVATGAGLIV
jgi:hypothetical protein